MSTVAQKLCDEIVEPALKQSSAGIVDKKLSKKFVYHYPNIRDNGNTTRSITIEKQRVINKLVPRNSNTSKTVINKFKSKETLLKKKYIDIAMNTIVTGPLRCDNNCVTMVRRRDNRCSCKCSQKQKNISKGSVKEIQTFDTKNFLLMDKACAQCVETASCGTQFLEKLSSKMKLQKNVGLKPQGNKTQQQSSINDLSKPSKHILKHQNSVLRQQPNLESNFSTRTKSYLQTSDVKTQPPIIVRQPYRSRLEMPNNVSSDYMGARRWALSHYLTRGPDF